LLFRIVASCRLATWIPKCPAGFDVNPLSFVAQPFSACEIMRRAALSGLPAPIRNAFEPTGIKPP